MLGDFNDYSVHREMLGAFGEPGNELALGALRERLRRAQADERKAFEARFEAFASDDNRQRAKRVFGQGGASSQ